MHTVAIILGSLDSKFINIYDMKFTLLITACYIPWYVELVEFKSHIVAAQESSSESNCELRTYPSSFLNGGCAECPENCEHEYHEDLEPCIKACGEC